MNISNLLGLQVQLHVDKGKTSGAARSALYSVAAGSHANTSTHCRGKLSFGLEMSQRPSSFEKGGPHLSSFVQNNPYMSRFRSQCAPLASLQTVLWLLRSLLDLTVDAQVGDELRCCQQLTYGELLNPHSSRDTLHGVLRTYYQALKPLESLEHLHLLDNTAIYTPHFSIFQDCIHHIIINYSPFTCH